MFSHRTHLAVALAVLFLATSSIASAERVGQPVGDRPAGKPCKPFRPNQPPAGTRPSFALPKIHRPQAKVVTWGIETQWQPVQYYAGGDTHYNRDPYKVDMTGYNEGTKIDLLLQQKSAKVAVPESCPGCTDGAPLKGKMSPEKWARKQRSLAWQKAVSQAQRWERLDGFTTTVPSHAQTQTEQRGNVLPTHTPYKLAGKDPFNRRYATLQGRVEGLPTTGAVQVTRPASNGYTQYGSQTQSGLHIPAYDVGANTNAENLYITPAYQKGEQVQAKLLGLAAFPAGAKVTITNLRKQGASEPDHTVQFTASKSGSGSIAVQGLQRDMLQVSVSFDGVANQEHATSYSFNVRIPKMSGKPAFKSRGIVYYQASNAE
jgi:hypothetical protein